MMKKKGEGVSKKSPLRDIFCSAVVGFILFSNGQKMVQLCVLS